MENSLDYIDAYFQGQPLPEETQQFENRLQADAAFAEEVAFYLAAKKAAKEQWAEQRKARFRELYSFSASDGHVHKQAPVRKLWPYVAAAAMVAGIILCWTLFLQPPSTQQMASEYINKNFTTLGVTMGTNEDALQKGLNLYNEGNLNKATQEFEKLINLDSSNFTALRYAGITALRLQQYDKALHYFNLLKNQQNLYANPGAFLQATTLLKRNLPGDKLAAKALLEEVIKTDGEGKETAEQWLKKW